MLLAFLSVAGAVQAQFALAPLKTFGSGGWVAPNGSNGSTYTYLTTGDTERGMAYGNGHVYLVSRNGGDFIRILDAQTGADVGTLNLSGGVVAGGTFNVNMVAVGGDGAIYVANLAVPPAAFRVYRWANDSSNSTPSLVYSGTPLTGARLGDSLAAVGSGNATRLAAGFSNSPNVAGNNGYAIIDATTGTATAIGFNGTVPAAGDFRLGLSFTDANHVIGTQGGAGSTLAYTTFADSAGTLLASLTPASTDERPMAFANVGRFPLMAALSTADNHVSLYDMTDPTHPVLLAQANATSGTLPADAHNTGAIAWGRITARIADLYAMATDDGIQAFTVSVPMPQPPNIVTQPLSQTVVELAPATFSVGATGNPIPSYQWLQSGTPMPGETNASYTLTAAVPSDNGAQFQVVVFNTITNVPHSLTSSVATLTVVADTAPPLLTGAQLLGGSQVGASFSKRISPATATNAANYAISGTNGNLAIFSAVQDATQSNIVLNVSAMISGSLYTLTVNHLTDQSATGNVILADSRTNFVAMDYAPTQLGSAAQPGSVTLVDGGYDVLGSGSDIGQTSDGCQFASQRRTGDFDFQVRVEALALSDLWAKAGVMVRGSLTANSRFVAVLATPSLNGSFLEYRDPPEARPPRLVPSRPIFPVVGFA